MMTKKNLFALVLCLFSLGTTTHAQRIPTLEEAVYGGLIKTEGGSNVSWMKDGERYSKIEKNAEGAYEVTAYKAKDNSKEVLIPAAFESADRKTDPCPQFHIQRG